MQVNVSLNLHVPLLKFERLLNSWGLSSSAHNCKLQCIFVLEPGWIYLVTTFSEKEVLSFNMKRSEKSPHCPTASFSQMPV